MNRTPFCVLLVILVCIVLYVNIGKKLLNSLHGLLSFEIGGFNRRVITS